MTALKKISFYLLIAIMLLPAIQYKFEIFKFRPLKGYFAPSAPPDFKWFTFKGWMSESFQKDFNKALESNMGFRNILIRLNNQVNYSLFRYTDNKKVVIGLNDCLFEEGYINEYLGKDFAGKDILDKRLNVLKSAQDFLKKKKNIDLIVVFEPGKATFHSEYIPPRFHPEIKTISNYDYLTRGCRDKGIKHIDLNAWFLSMKEISPYPLYPEYAVHWSTYGMCIAMDSITRYIEKTRAIRMPRLDYSSVEYSSHWVDADFDIESTLNLIFRLRHPPMAYPEIRFIHDSSVYKPKVLTIGDSYCWSIYDFKIPQNIFATYDYWYYNKVVYPDIWTEHHPVGKLDFKKEIEKQEIILIMITEMNLRQAFWDFPEQVCNAYYVH